MIPKPTLFGSFCLSAIVILALGTFTTCARERRAAAGPQKSSQQATVARVGVSPRPGIFSAPRSVWVTTYHNKYHGRRTKSGEVFLQDRFTCAVPRSLWESLKGKTLRFQRPGGGIALARVTDTVGPGVGNFDLSRAAWNALTDHAAPSRVRAQMGILKEQ